MQADIAKQKFFYPGFHSLSCRNHLQFSLLCNRLRGILSAVTNMHHMGALEAPLLGKFFSFNLEKMFVATSLHFNTIKGGLEYDLMAVIFQLQYCPNIHGTSEVWYIQVWGCTMEVFTGQKPDFLGEILENSCRIWMSISSSERKSGALRNCDGQVSKRSWSSQ